MWPRTRAHTEVWCGAASPTPSPLMARRRRVALAVAAAAAQAPMSSFAQNNELRADFSGPTAVIALPSGHLLVADTNNHRLVELSPAGRMLHIVGGPPARAPAAAGDAESTIPTRCAGF